MKWLLDAMRDKFKGSHSIALTATQAGYHPSVRQRPVIGVGGVPQYFLDAQMLSLNSIAGGGTLSGNPPKTINGPLLAFQPNISGGPTQTGNLVSSRVYMGLLAERGVMPSARGEKM